MVAALGGDPQPAADPVVGLRGLEGQVVEAEGDVGVGDAVVRQHQRALGALTFHERALLLKQFALSLTARKDELYDLSAKSGSTRRDSLSDIDGGIGTYIW